MRSILLTSVGVVMWATSPVMADNLSPYEMGPWAGAQGLLNSGQPFNSKFTNEGSKSSPIIIPNRGEATYNGTLMGTGKQYYALGPTTVINGRSALTANFTQHSITGVFTGDGSVAACAACTIEKGYINLRGTGEIRGAGIVFPTLTGTFGSIPVPAPSYVPFGEASNSAFATGSFQGTLAQTVTGNISASSGPNHPSSFSGTFAAHR